MSWKPILNLLSIVVLILSFFMVVPIGVSIYYGGPDLKPLLYSFAVSLLSGFVIFMLTRRYRKEELRHKDGFIAVSLSWIVVAFLGSLPYMLSGTFTNFADMYFEAMAGFTTTGASVMTDIEGVPKGILMWRSLSQWIGGMGIVLFSLAILPMLGGGGMQLFKAEVPEISVDKLRPRIIDTAKALWYIYASLTLLAALLFFFGGMSPYDAFSHAFTTLATGGFSTKNTSIAYFNSPYIDVVTTIFMFLAGINYTLYFYGLKGNLARFTRSDEFRFFLGITLVSIGLLTLNLWHREYETLLESLRYASFQVVSIMTTTGFATADYEQWSGFAQMMIVTIMFFGGMIGSTGGGMKQVRILLMFKQAYRELYQLIHPRAVTVIKLDEKHLPKDVLGSIWGFLFLFIIIWVVATLGLAFLGLDIITASSTAVSALCNVGPALGIAGPADNYASLPQLAKWILIFCMLAGRLEIYTVVILFVPHFWKK
jgi:trk system potassium uptake protein TrkH